MEIKQSFFLAIKSLATSKVRALLTMLGIIIGVAAVIVIISLGDGMQKMMNDQFETMGSNLIQVQVFGGSNTSRSVSPDDMYELVENNPKYLAAVSPYVGVGGVSVASSTQSFTPSSILGGSEDYLSIRGMTLDEGRPIQYVDVLRQQKICIIGSYINNEYFDGNGLNQTISIAGYTYTIVGVLSETAESRKGTEDDQILLPYTNAMQLSGQQVSAYMFTGADKDSAAMSRTLIENKLKSIFGADDDVTRFMVITSAEMLDMMNTMMNTMMVVLVAIAAISLLVGGIGIMNIMLVSVSERTREIGIRKSLGAKRKDIRSQFIIEAGTTSAVGGVIGIVLGVLFANLAGSLISGMEGAESFTAVTSLSAIGVAFGVSVAVGIIFGYLPANKAAKLNPIDALRYD